MKRADRAWCQEGDRVKLVSPAWCAVGSRAREAAGQWGRRWAVLETVGPAARGRERGQQQLGLRVGVGLALGSRLHFVAWGSPAASQVMLVTVLIQNSCRAFRHDRLGLDTTGWVQPLHSEDICGSHYSHPPTPQVFRWGLRSLWDIVGVSLIRWGLRYLWDVVGLSPPHQMGS